MLLKGKLHSGAVIAQGRAWRAERDGAGEVHGAQTWLRAPITTSLWSSLLSSVIPLTLCSSHSCLLPESPMHQAHPAHPAARPAGGLHLCYALGPGYSSPSGTRSPVQVSTLTFPGRAVSLTPGLLPQLVCTCPPPRSPTTGWRGSDHHRPICLGSG